MARTNYNCSPEHLTEVWQRAKNSDQAAHELGMPKEIMFARASGYRRRGVRLKRMPRSPKNKVKVEELNQLIDGLGPQTKSTEKNAEAGGPIAF